MRKYEKLYELAKEDFYAEIDRLNRIERKATSLLSVLTLLIGVNGMVAAWAFGRGIPPDSFIEGALVLLVVLVVASLFASWIFVFRVFTIDRRPAIAVSNSIIQFYDDNKTVNVYYGMSRRISEKSEENRSLARKKAGRLTIGYYGLMVTGALLIVLLILGGTYRLRATSSAAVNPQTQNGDVNDSK